MRKIHPAWWVAAELDEGEASVALDEELGASTYRYLARPGGGIAAGTDLMFVVAGYKNETDPKPVVFGHSGAPVRFGDGEVRVYDFPLVTFADSFHGVSRKPEDRTSTSPQTTRPSHESGC